MTSQAEREIIVSGMQERGSGVKPVKEDACREPIFGLDSTSLMNGEACKEAVHGKWHNL